MNEWLRNFLVCPRDRSKLEESGNKLTCREGHSYSIVDGIPIMLIDDGVSTHGYIEQTLESVARIEAGEDPADVITIKENAPDEVDQFVKDELPYTCGNLYFPAMQGLDRYPFPEIRLPETKNGEKLLDVGCNWGRWSIAAEKKGYSAVGIDPSLNAVLAARRIARQFGLDPTFVVGDARFLPFADDAFDVAFSYGVLQHFSKENAKTAMDEMVRVLKPGHPSLLQMPNKFGIRSRQQHWRRGFTEGEGFDVRYWTPSELVKTFEEKFGPTRISTDCYFGLGIQKTDLDLMPMRYKIVVHSSDILRRISQVFTPLVSVADSVYLDSVNTKKSKTK